MSIPDRLLTALVQSCSYLVDVHLAPDAKLLRALSRLPYLKSLALDLVHLDRGEKLSKDEDIGQAFLALSSLILRCLSPLPQVSAFLENAGCFARESLTIRVTNSFEAEELTPLIRALIDPVHSTRLDTFILDCDFEPVAPHCEWDGESDDSSVGTPGLEIDLNSIWPLLCCRELRVLEIYSWLYPTVRILLAEEIERMTRAWPRIEFLAFDYEIFGSSVADHLGLCTLMHTSGEGAEYKLRPHDSKLDNPPVNWTESTCTLPRRELEIDLVRPWERLFPKIALPQYTIHVIGDETTVEFLPGEGFQRLWDSGIVQICT